MIPTIDDSFSTAKRQSFPDQPNHVEDLSHLIPEPAEASETLLSGLGIRIPFPKLKAFIEKGEHQIDEVMGELLTLPYCFWEHFANYLSTALKNGSKIKVEAVTTQIVKTHILADPADQNTHLICLTLFSKFLTKIPSEPLSLPIYGQEFRLVQSTLQKYQITLNLIDVDLIVKNGYGRYLRSGESVYTDLRKVETFSETRLYNDTYLDELLNNRGFDLQICLENSVDIVERLIIWDLKAQSPVKPFLESIQRHPTLQEALLAWAIGENKEKLDTWYNPTQSATSVANTSIDNSNLTRMYGNQNIYNREIGKSIELASLEIKNGWGFETLSLFAAYRRMLIAKWQDHQDRIKGVEKRIGWFPHEFFGFLRGTPNKFQLETKNRRLNLLTELPITNLNGVYSRLADRLVRLHETQQLNSGLAFPTKECMPNYFYSSTRVPVKSVDKYVNSRADKSQPLGTFYIKIDEKPIPLSFLVRQVNEDCYAIIHTPCEYLEVLTGECQKRYQLALQEKDIDKLMFQLGRLFWLICQAKLWIRGDPSIAEIIVRSVLLSKDWKAPSWKKGIIPWEEVSIYIDGDDFGRDFASLFEGGLAGFSH